MVNIRPAFEVTWDLKTRRDAWRMLSMGHNDLHVADSNGRLFLLVCCWSVSSSWWPQPNGGTSAFCYQNWCAFPLVACGTDWVHTVNKSKSTVRILIFGSCILLRPFLWLFLGVPSIAIIFISLLSFSHHYIFRPLQAILRCNIHRLLEAITPTTDPF
jgi:hypothetical protein